MGYANQVIGGGDGRDRSPRRLADGRRGGRHRRGPDARRGRAVRGGRRERRARGRLPRRPDDPAGPPRRDRRPERRVPLLRLARRRDRRPDGAAVDRRRLVRDVRAVSPVPVAVGFGVSKPAHVGAIAKAGADGVIVASALVDALGPDGRDVDALTGLVGGARGTTTTVDGLGEARGELTSWLPSAAATGCLDRPVSWAMARARSRSARRPAPRRRSSRRSTGRAGRAPARLPSWRSEALARLRAALRHRREGGRPELPRSATGALRSSSGRRRRRHRVRRPVRRSPTLDRRRVRRRQADAARRPRRGRLDGLRPRRRRRARGAPQGAPRRRPRPRQDDRARHRGRRAYAREIGLKLPTGNPTDRAAVDAMRAAVLEVLPPAVRRLAARRPNVDRSLCRPTDRLAALDHAWEMEDRAETLGVGRPASAAVTRSSVRSPRRRTAIAR